MDMVLLNISDGLDVKGGQTIEVNSHPIETGSLQSERTRERVIRCYATHFQSWCQAFGEHENIMEDDHDGCWLLGEGQIGVVLSKPAFRQLNREIVFQGKTRTLVFDEKGIRIGQYSLDFRSKSEKHVLSMVDQLFESGANLHLFRTLHFLYGNDKRILTLSRKRPQPFIYRETGTINVRL